MGHFLWCHYGSSGNLSPTPWNFLTLIFLEMPNCLGGGTDLKKKSFSSSCTQWCMYVQCPTTLTLIWSVINYMLVASCDSPKDWAINCFDWPAASLSKPHYFLAITIGKISQKALHCQVQVHYQDKMFEVAWLVKKRVCWRQLPSEHQESSWKSVSWRGV